MISDAVISPCGLHRTRLWRIWDPEADRALFLMLNPSTAGPLTNDATVLKTIKFAKREGCGGVEIGNLYSFRTKDPKELKAAIYPNLGENDRILVALIKNASGPVICAWGANAQDDRALFVRMAARHAGVPLFHLGPRNANGSPRHPLYLKDSTPLIEWV